MKVFRALVAVLALFFCLTAAASAGIARHTVLYFYENYC